MFPVVAAAAGGGPAARVDVVAGSKRCRSAEGGFLRARHRLPVASRASRAGPGPSGAVATGCPPGSEASKRLMQTGAWNANPASRLVS